MNNKKLMFVAVFLVAVIVGGMLLQNLINMDGKDAYAYDALPVSESGSISFDMDISSGAAIKICEEASASVFENPENEEESVPVYEIPEDDEMYASYIAVKDYCGIVIEQLIAQSREEAAAYADEYIKAGYTVKKVIEYDGYGYISAKSAHIYDSQGNLMKYTSYHGDGTIWTCKEYSYDSEGKLTKETGYNKEGTVSWWKDYIYNRKGELMKIPEYHGDGTFYMWNEYDYDKQGNRTKEVRHYSDGAIDYWREYSYNDQGDRTKEVKYNSDGIIEYWYEYIYE